MSLFFRAVLFAACFVLCASHFVAAQENPPNVVFILADDLGWADLGCYGADLHETPNLDRLAKQGMRFTNAYAAAPICSPTRASIMTGKYPARLNMTIWYEGSQRSVLNRRMIPPKTIGNLPHSNVTLAEVLNQAGYLTSHVGKWHLGDAAHYPETQGFDVNIGGTFWGAPSTFFYPYRGFWGRSMELRYVPGLEWGQKGEYLTDRLTDEALKIIEQAKDRPFYLNLWYHTVHTPIEAKQQIAAKFRRKLKPEMHHQNPVFAGMVHSLDENVGRVLQKLEELQLAENTLVIFTSDNGGYINQYRGETVTNNFPLRSGKGSLFEGGIRVPLIVRVPGLTRPGSVSHESVITTDFYPTLLKLLQLKGKESYNAEIDGQSFVPLLQNPQAKLSRETLYFHYPHYYATTTPVSALRDGDWKLLRYHEDDRLELYNLKSDPGEKDNLEDKMPGRAGKLNERLQRWLISMNAQMPKPNPKFQRR